jgi:glycosyltransferase involved in cell wall biosynthesis
MPTIAAVIVTRNRSKDLRNALGQLSKQTRKPDQLIVVDDFSSDDTRAVAAEFAAKYVRLPRPQGCLYARNLACETTDCDFVVSLDDDSWFLEENGLALAEKVLAENPHAAVVTFNIANPDGSITYPLSDSIMPTRTFIGCGHILRRKLFIEAGGYPDFFEGHGEEKAASMSLLRDGYSILAAPAIRVEHAFSPLERNWQRMRFREHRNDILREVMYCPSIILAPRLVLAWIRHSKYNLQHKYLTTDLKVLVDFPRLVGTAFRQRRPLTLEAYKAWHAIKS